MVREPTTSTTSRACHCRCERPAVRFEKQDIPEVRESNDSYYIRHFPALARLPQVTGVIAAYPYLDEFRCHAVARWFDADENAYLCWSSFRWCGRVLSLKEADLRNGLFRAGDKEFGDRNVARTFGQA